MSSIRTKINPYEGVDVKGKVIVVAGLPAEIAAQQAAGRGGRGGRGGARCTRGGWRRRARRRQSAPAAANANPLGEACTDFLTPEQYGAKNGALAVVTIANFQQLATMANPNAGGFGGFGAADAPA